MINYKIIKKLHSILKTLKKTLFDNINSSLKIVYSPDEATEKKELSQIELSNNCYEEDLPCGGTLKVYKNSWHIQYFFSGPDRRYNGTFKYIHDSEVDEYIFALRSNWSEYVRLREATPKGGSLTIDGKMGMSIHVGGVLKGVCMFGFHKPIYSSYKLEQIIKGYYKAMERSQEIRALMRGTL